MNKDTFSKEDLLAYGNKEYERGLKAMGTYARDEAISSIVEEAIKQTRAEDIAAIDDLWGGLDEVVAYKQGAWADKWISWKKDDGNAYFWLVFFSWALGMYLSFCIACLVKLLISTQ